MTKQELIDQKWDAIASASETMGAVRADLFDKVALALSRVEGKMNFLNSEDHDGNSRIAEGHSQKVAVAVQEEVSEVRKELDKIFGQLTIGRDKLLS